MPPLKNPRHEAFCHEYLKDGNGAQAVVAAGYHVKTWKDGSTSASAMGCNLLKQAKVAARLEELKVRAAHNVVIDRTRVLTELGRIGFSDARQFFNADGRPKPITQLSDDAAAAVSSFELSEDVNEGGERRGMMRKYRLWDKPNALVTLAKHLGLLQEPVAPPTISGEYVQFNVYLPQNNRSPAKRLVKGNSNGRGK